ncbi:recombinase family protein [Ruminococcus flavefaciens]|uniref:recombinase family protein n=1 Tax=Ruminococcus flavefaciens TaxID=1265 RepID=UPI0009311E8B
MNTERAELKKLLKIVNTGDTIISTEVSRITRSTKQLCEIIELAKTKHLKLILGTFIVDCSRELDPMTEGMLKMMGVFSELERNIISQRVKSGMEMQKQRENKLDVLQLQLIISRVSSINTIPNIKKES